MRSLFGDQTSFRIFDVVVFVDWYGTLSSHRFWQRITDNESHPLANTLGHALETLFVEDKRSVRSWMRGEISEEEIIGRLGVRLPRNYRADYLLRQLLDDCRRADVDEDMSALVRQFVRQAYVVVASDNMRCFAEAAPEILLRNIRVDGLLTSAELGVLKGDDPDRFFRSTLEDLGLKPGNAVLIDDCVRTCEVFRKWGGTAHVFSDVDTLRNELKSAWWAPASMRSDGGSVTALWPVQR
jgi:FMN phosphatase YigB (HAD superfamily)